MRIPKESVTNIKQSLDSTSSTEVNSKRKRNSNFSKEEVQCLITEYGARTKTINFGTRQQKQKSWEAITTVMNNMHHSFTRSATEIKKKWIDLLYSTKKEYSKVKTEAEKTGSKKRRRLSDIAEMVLQIKGEGFLAKKHDGTQIKEEVDIETPISLDNGKLKEENVTTFYIPHIDECPSSGDSREATDSANSPETMENVNLNASDGGIKPGVDYNNYGQILNVSAPTTCTCGLFPEYLHLKQEIVNIMRREAEIEEERRNEEKLKWWEEKAIRHLKIQKLELEIKLLKSSMAIQL